MRTEIDVLESRSEHETFRSELRNQIARRKSRRTLGLVIESHLPVRVNFREYPLRSDMIAALKCDFDSPGYEVLDIEGDTEVVRMVQAPTVARLQMSSDWKVRRRDFKPTRSSLSRRSASRSTPGSEDWVPLVEVAARSHTSSSRGRATTLWRQCSSRTPGGLTCIYIKPAYNGGAREWEYDNHNANENYANPPL